MAAGRLRPVPGVKLSVTSANESPPELLANEALELLRSVAGVAGVAGELFPTRRLEKYLGFL